MIAKEGGDMITIAEYVEWKQPEVAEKLHLWARRAKVLVLPFWRWKSIMEERPLPGRAGGLA